jgi:lipoic acid synthetase
MAPGLYKTIRKHSDYERSLRVLGMSKEINPGLLTKSGFMLGLGETKEEVCGILDDLRKVKVDILTIGQYLRPSKEKIEVKRFVPPEEFKEWELEADKKGFKHVFSGPFIRSSFNAGRVFAAKESDRN